MQIAAFKCTDLAYVTWTCLGRCVFAGFHQLFIGEKSLSICAYDRAVPADEPATGRLEEDSWERRCSRSGRDVSSTRRQVLQAKQK